MTDPDTIPQVIRFEVDLDVRQADAVVELLEAFGCNSRVWTEKGSEIR